MTSVTRIAVIEAFITHHYCNLNRPEDIAKSSEASQGRNGERPEELTTPRAENQSKLRDYIAIYDPELDRAKPKSGNQVIYRFNGDVKPGVSIFITTEWNHCSNAMALSHNLAYHIWQLVYDSWFFFYQCKQLIILLFPRKFQFIHQTRA